MNRKICIDISNIVPGKGGTGGGITTYSINLITNLAQLYKEKEFDIVCIKNINLDITIKDNNLLFYDVNINNSNVFIRMFWLHIRLPLFCYFKGIDILHRVVPELPFIKVCKYAVTVHDFMFDLYLNSPFLSRYLNRVQKYKFLFLRKMTSLAIKKSDLIIAPSQSIEAELKVKSKFAKARKIISTIYEASEAAPLFNCPPKLDDDKVLKIGVIAGFYPHKGHLKVLKLAGTFLSNGFFDFKISFRGSHVYNNYVEDLKEEVLKLNLSKYVAFEPFEEKVTLANIYSKFNLVLLLSEYEGFGLPLLEAQAHHIPVVCSDIPVFREILVDSALFFPLDFTSLDVIELISKIRNETLLKEIGRIGAENVKRFSWKTMCLETLESYKKCLV